MKDEDHEIFYAMTDCSGIILFCFPNLPPQPKTKTDTDQDILSKKK